MNFVSMQFSNRLEIDSIEDEDEVLLVLAEKLGIFSFDRVPQNEILFLSLFLLDDLCKYIGGAEHLPCLLEPMSLLICGEESAVRDQVGH